MKAWDRRIAYVTVRGPFVRNFAWIWIFRDIKSTYNVHVSLIFVISAISISFLTLRMLGKILADDLLKTLP